MSVFEYDEITLYRLIYEFETWEGIVKRKNASKDKRLVEIRKDSIISTYNKIITYCQNIFKGKNKELKASTEKRLLNIRDRAIECLAILNASVKIPLKVTQIITIDKNSGESNTNMTLTQIEYYNLCTRTIAGVYEGDALGLTPFIKSIKLLQALDKDKAYGETLSDFILTRLKGIAIECIPENIQTADEIIIRLKENIKPENSKVIAGRMMAVRADRNNFADYTKKTEELAEKLKRALVLEGIPNEKANEMTVDKTIELCRTNTTSGLVKSVLASTKFNDAKDVIAKYIIESRTETAENKVLAFGTKRVYNNRRFQNDTRNQFQNRGYYNQGYNNRGNNNRTYGYSNYRGRGNYQQNNRGRNQNYYPNNRNNSNNFSNRNNSNNYNTNNRFNNRGRNNNRIYYSENAEALPSGASHTALTENQN